MDRLAPRADPVISHWYVLRFLVLTTSGTYPNMGTTDPCESDALDITLG